MPGIPTYGPMSFHGKNLDSFLSKRDLSTKPDPQAARLSPLTLVVLSACLQASWQDVSGSTDQLKLLRKLVKELLS